MQTGQCKRNMTYENRQQICQKKHIVWKQTTNMSKETYHMKTDNKYVKRNISYENRQQICQKRHSIWKQTYAKETQHMRTENKYVKRNISYENRQVCQKKHIIWIHTTNMSNPIIWKQTTSMSKEKYHMKTDLCKRPSDSRACTQVFKIHVYIWKSHVTDESIVQYAMCLIHIGNVLFICDAGI